jgi:hypothetical protein
LSLCLLHDIRKETTERLIYVTKNLLSFGPYEKYEHTREYRKNERRKDGKGIRERGWKEGDKYRHDEQV